jgi:DNA polymerase-3 subunit delta'
MFHPRLAKILIGHQKAFASLNNFYEKDCLNPCWILNGQRGIGKATFAYQFALYLLSQNPHNPQGLSKSLVERQIHVGSYPNLLVVEKPVNEGEADKEIPLEEAKKVLPFLNQSAVIPGWRVVIIDAANEFNRSAANCLLKTLEAPPKKVLFLLISHAWGQVLPTIRSRCQRLDFLPLNYQDLANSEVSVEEELFDLCYGSLGQYQMLIKAGGGDFMQLLMKMIQCAREGQWIQLQKFCQDTAKIPERFECFLWLLPRLVYQKCLTGRGSEQQLWLTIEQKLNTFLTKAKTSHLDKNQLMLNCFLLIENPYII